MAIQISDSDQKLLRDLKFSWLHGPYANGQAASTQGGDLVPSQCRTVIQLKKPRLQLVAMSRSPLSFVSKFLSRSPALAADTLSVAASFPEQGVSIALGYLAVALGILSWETVDQWLTDQKIQDLKDRASTTDKYVRDVKSLIQLVRARTWPAIENLIQVL